MKTYSKGELEVKVKVYWKNAEKHPAFEFANNWTCDEFITRIQQMRGILNSVLYAVMLICDCRAAPTFTTRYLAYFYEANRNLAANLLMRILVSEPKQLALLTISLQQAIPRNLS